MTSSDVIIDVQADRKPGTGESHRLLIAVRILTVGVVVLAALRLAWIGDDALISLRNVLNITHGWGPGFNATESVQAYTHPLWFLLWVLVGSVTGQWIIGILVVSLVFTGLAVGLLAWRTSSIARLIFAAALLVMSNAFLEYATSGLENPLAYAMVGLLLAMTLGSGAVGHTHSGRSGALWCALIGLTFAAVVLTRLDLALLVLPIGVLWLFEYRRELRLIAVAAVSTIVPLAAWFAWSAMTYSSLLPNTFAAKRNLDIPQAELVTQGFRYLWVTFEHDPVSLVALALGVVGAIALGNRATRAWATGVLLYIAYVVWIGGDFMAGRFFAVPVYVAVFLVATVRLRPANEDESAEPEAESNATAILVSLAAVVALLLGSAYSGSTPVALSNQQTARWEFDWNLNGGIADERGVWVGGSGRGLSDIVDNLALAFTQPDFVWPSSGQSMSRSLRELDKAAKNWPQTDTYIGLPADVTVICGGLGSMGIVAGPTVHIIDDCGLSDRFLAEKTFSANNFQWRVGDYHRAIPEGYEEAIRQDNPALLTNQVEAFALAKLWEKIRP